MWSIIRCKLGEQFDWEAWKMVEFQVNKVFLTVDDELDEEVDLDELYTEHGNPVGRKERRAA